MSHIPSGNAPTCPYSRAKPEPSVLCGFCSCFAWPLKVSCGESLLGISLQIMESEGLSLPAILSCRSQPAAVHVQHSCQCLFGHTGRKIPVCREFSYRPQRDGVCPRLRVSQQLHVGASFPCLSLSTRCRRMFLGCSVGAVLRGLRGTFGWQWVQRVLALSTPSPEACCPPHHHPPQLHRTQPCSGHWSCQVPSRGGDTKYLQPHFIPCWDF